MRPESGCNWSMISSLGIEGKDYLSDQRGRNFLLIVVGGEVGLGKEKGTAKFVDSIVSVPTYRPT
jgi:hypothetical protein